MKGTPRGLSRGSSQELTKYQSSSEQFIIKDEEIYLYYPDGYGKTKLSNALFEKKLKVIATTRNWNTVKKLTEI